MPADRPYYFNHAARRIATGSFITELPAALLILFFLFMVPLINLASATLKVYQLRTAALEALHRAARAQVFVQDIPPTPPLYPTPALSANTIYRNELNGFISKGWLAPNQLTVTAQPVVCVAEPIGGGSPITYTAALAPNQVDTTKYNYFYEVHTQGLAYPVLSAPPGGLIPTVPGLSGPMVVDITGRQMVEKPRGLIK